MTNTIIPRAATKIDASFTATYDFYELKKGMALVWEMRRVHLLNASPNTMVPDSFNGQIADLTRILQ